MNLKITKSKSKSHDKKEAEKNKHLYANKSTLQMWSPVFRAMLAKDNSIEGETLELELPGKNYEDVLELLKVMHPPMKPLTGKCPC